MAFKSMTEEEMTEYLKSYNQLNDIILAKKQKLFEEIETLEDAIQRNTFSGPKEEVISFNSNFAEKNKNHTVLLQSYQDIQNEIEEVSERLWHILEEEERYKYVQGCLDRLPLLQGQIIAALYIEGMSWEEYGKMRCMSRSTIGRQRKRAMDNLLVIYNTNAED